MNPGQRSGPYNEEIRHKMKGTANKVAPVIELSRFDLPRFLRWALILIIYLILFSALDQLAHALQLFPGVVAWYPPDGLSLAFLLSLGGALYPSLR